MLQAGRECRAHRMRKLSTLKSWTVFQAVIRMGVKSNPGNAEDAIFGGRNSGQEKAGKGSYQNVQSSNEKRSIDELQGALSDTTNRVRKMEENSVGVVMQMLDNHYGLSMPLVELAARVQVPIGSWQLKGRMSCPTAGGRPENPHQWGRWRRGHCCRSTCQVPGRGGHGCR